MKLATVKVELEDIPGALLRTLALAERRGFEIRRVEAEARVNDRLSARLHCRHDGRDPRQLILQLEKLADVVSVEALAVSMVDEVSNDEPDRGQGLRLAGFQPLLASRFSHG